MRKLPYPLDRASNLEVLTSNDREPCGLPEFPEDSDEEITVLFRLSLNQFMALATAVDVGSDIAYGDDGIKVWYLWAVSIMCAQFCEEMAECLITENPAVVEALSTLITNNQTIITAVSNAITNAGSGIPGQPLSETQANSDTLPENVRDEEGDCDLNALWGACLFLVQSGNRAITDFFEQIEVASNTLETSAIVSQTIPAAGAYVSAAVEFADQLQENLAEGYTGAYTETYEQELACALFCIARTGCELTPNMLMDVMAVRLGYVDGTENFGTLMARIGVGVFVGSAIADSAFYIYFSALRFGQQFGDTLGFRPLTDLMSLGADQLASDNWEILCDCPDCGIGFSVDIGSVDGDNIIAAATEFVVTLVDPMLSAYARRIQITFDTAVTSVTLGWNTEGAGDDMYALLDGNAYQGLPSPSGSTTLVFGTPGTVLTVDLGYTLDSGGYASNPARITVTDACV